MSKRLLHWRSWFTSYQNLSWITSYIFFHRVSHLWFRKTMNINAALRFTLSLVSDDSLWKMHTQPKGTTRQWFNCFRVSFVMTMRVFIFVSNNFQIIKTVSKFASLANLTLHFEHLKFYPVTKRLSVRHNKIET